MQKFWVQLTEQELDDLRMAVSVMYLGLSDEDVEKANSLVCLSNKLSTLVVNGYA